MNIITIPEAFTEEKRLSTTLFDYRTREACNKQFIKLTQNAFSFLIEGTKEVIADNSSVVIQNTHFLLIKSGHCLMSEKQSSANKNYRSILLFFSGEDLLRFVRKFEKKRSKKSPLKSVYAFSHDDFTQKFIQSLIEIAALPSGIQKKLIPVKLEEIVLYLTEVKGGDFLYSMIASQDNRTQHFIRVVERNKFKKLTLRELAFLSNMSISSFKRAFQKHYAESPMKWFQDQRLERASFLLKQEQRRPSDIYMEVGYETLSSFIQAFKLKYGSTPKQHQSL